MKRIIIIFILSSITVIGCKKTDETHLFSIVSQTNQQETEEDSFNNMVSQMYQQALRLLERNLYEILQDYPESKTVYPGEVYILDMLYSPQVEVDGNEKPSRIIYRLDEKYCTDTIFEIAEKMIPTFGDPDKLHKHPVNYTRDYSEWIMKSGPLIKIGIYWGTYGDVYELEFNNYLYLFEEESFSNMVSQIYQQALRLLERNYSEILQDYPEPLAVYPADVYILDIPYSPQVDVGGNERSLKLTYRLHEEFSMDTIFQIMKKMTPIFGEPVAFYKDPVNCTSNFCQWIMRDNSFIDVSIHWSTYSDCYVLEFENFIYED